MGINSCVSSLIDFSLIDTPVTPVENRRRLKQDSAELTFDKLFNRDTKKFNNNNDSKYPKTEKELFIHKLPRRQQINNPNSKVQNGISRKNADQRRQSSNPHSFLHDDINRR